jgi:hypothetical protein
VNYRRLSLYLDKLQAYQVKRLALLEKWETADLLRVLIVLGMHEDFGNKEYLTKRLTHGSAVSHVFRPIKAILGSSLIMDLRLPAGLAVLIDIYAQRTAASRNQALAELLLAGTKAYCQTELSFHEALKAAHTTRECESGQQDPT